MAPKPTPTEGAAAFRRSVVEWVIGIERQFNVTRAQIAERSGIKSSTIYRWFDQSLNHVPSNASVLQIANAFGVTGPGSVTPSPPLANEEGLTVAEAPPGETWDHATQNWWRVGDRALELAGYLPGDLVLCDPKVAARQGDVVVAVLHRAGDGLGERRLRLFVPPFLVTRSMDPHLHDMADLVDGHRVMVSGPILRLVRHRDA